MLTRLVLLASCTVLMAAAQPSAAAKTAFERGESALAAGKLDAATAAYKEALTRTPGYAAAINGLGTVYFKQGKREEAIAQFKAATEADTSFPVAFFNLAFAARKSGDHATAAQAYESYVLLMPDDPDGFYGLAESYRALDENEKALQAYRKFVSKESRPSEKKYVDEARAAIAALDKTARQPLSAPGAVPPGAASGESVPNESLGDERIATGDRLMAEKRYREAAAAYLDGANANASSTEAHFKLASAYAQLGYYGQAIARWKRVIELQPEGTVAKASGENIAKATKKLGVQVDASGMDLGPISESARLKARKAYEEGVERIGKRQYGTAAESLSVAIQLEPSLAVAYVARGSAQIGLRRYQEAATDYQFALRLDPSLSAPLYGLGEAYRALGRGGDAKSYYERYASATSFDVSPELQADARKKAAQIR